MCSRKLIFDVNFSDYSDISDPETVQNSRFCSSQCSVMFSKDIVFILECLEWNSRSQLTMQTTWLTTVASSSTHDGHGSANQRAFVTVIGHGFLE